MANFQHDGGYASPALGKRKMEEQTGLQLLTDSGERKRRIGRMWAMLDELESLNAGEMDAMAGELATAKEDNAGLTTKIRELQACNSKMELKVGTLFQLIKDLLKQKAGMVSSSRTEMGSVMEEISMKDRVIAELVSEKEQLKLKNAEKCITNSMLQSQNTTLEQLLGKIREVVYS
jgi:hypothetical protein